MMTNELVYLASPYSHQEAWMREMRFRAIARVAGKLAHEDGMRTFCPIVHGHAISRELSEVSQIDRQFWTHWCEPFEAACARLLICMLPGWDTSIGVADERKTFQLEGKPIDHLNPRKWFTKTEWKMLEAYHADV